MSMIQIGLLVWVKRSSKKKLFDDWAQQGKFLQKSWKLQVEINFISWEEPNIPF